MAKNKSTKTRSVLERKVVTPSQSSGYPISKGFFNFFPERNPVLISVLLFGLVAAVFLPSIRNGFFYWYGDDTGYVTENIHVKSGFTWESVKWAFRNIDIGNWHPLAWLSHMLDVQFYGLKPWGHHLTSVLLHAANTLLLFILLRRTTQAMWRSLVVALLFGLHPLRVESVGWIAERKDVLAAFFWMLTLWFYVRFAEESKAQSPKAKVFYGLALLGFACGLMSKGMVVTLPFVLLLLDYWPLERMSKAQSPKSQVEDSANTPLWPLDFRLWTHLLLEKAPFFCLAIVTSVITYAAQTSWGFVQSVEKYPWPARLENGAISYVRYIGKMFWPVDLCGYYPHPGKWPLATVSIAVIFIVGISIFAFVMRRRGPWFLVGWIWYLGTLVPVIGLVQLGDVAMADRYSYIPMVGILVPLVWGLHQWTKQWRYHAALWPPVVIAILISFVAITEKQIGYYKDSVTMWRHNFQVTKNIDVSQHALGMSLDQQGRTDEGIQELQAVVQARPDRSNVRFNLGTMLLKKERLDEAIKEFREVLRLNSGSNDARYNLAVALLKKGVLNEAATQFQQVIQMNRDPRAYNALGTMYASNSKPDEAINCFNEVLRVKPDSVDAHNNLGIVLSDKGQIKEAILHFQEALRLDPSSAIARTYLDSLQKTGKATNR